MAVVTGTYRLQLHAGFGFDAAARVLPFLHQIGVSHLYLSPILQAVAGSMHGYDVLDHSRVSDDLGGHDAYVNLATEAGDRGLGVIVDVVPNHMAFVAPENLNRPLWDVLRDGRDAPTADWFDVDWKAGGGRIGLPILGDELDVVLAAGEFQLDELTNADGRTELVIRYHDHLLPVALGTEGSATLGETDATVIRGVLDRQHYRLASWREKDSVLNYRRFFEVDSLIAVRVELEKVFLATHQVLLDLHHAGLIDGFRIDHPDGLADPGAYLELLKKHTKRDTPVWVEKILEGDESLPADWACVGTTGYDGLRAISAGLVDTAAAADLTAAWEAAGAEHSLEESSDLAKRHVVVLSLGPEVERLVRRAREALPDLDPERLREAIVELLVAGEVYRAYVRPDEALSDEARHRLTEAFTKARASRPDLEAELFALMPLTVPTGSDDAAALDFSTRLQQTWGPVMAKGLEDTMFYRFHRLVALNEVGGSPDDLDTGGPELLHAWAERQQKDWPLGMIATSTHDTKRSEDVRARILAVAGDVGTWAACSAAARLAAEDAGIDPEAAHLVWQTLLGVDDIDRDRLDGYLRKALREAKRHTAWVDGDADYEDRVVAFADQARTSGPLHDALQRAVTTNEAAIRAVVLAQATLKLTLPGVPDTYQGCSRLNLSLVDPDNRRPVDFGSISSRLAAFDESGLPVGADLSDEKLYVTSKLLRFRRRTPRLQRDMTYTPLESTTEHALGFVRATTVPAIGGFKLGRENRLATVVTRAPARLYGPCGPTPDLAAAWGDATVRLPEGEWVDLLTDSPVAGGDVRCADLLGRLPVAVLVS